MKPAFVLVMALGILIRFWALDADPSILLDSGQIGDEGYWLYNAKSLALFGKTVPDQFYHDFAAAPLFSFASYLSFLNFGVGFWQARLVSALAGIVTLLLTFMIAKQINERVALLATFIVSINTMLLLHNRLAVGESLSIMFATAGFYLLFLKRNTRVFSGAAFALSLLSKTTSFLYLPSSVLMMLSDVRRASDIKRPIYFSLSLAILFSFVFGILYLEWGNEIRLIYSTFGSWYAPRTIFGIWQNILNLFLHPFWGSPFLFSTVILASLNSLHFLLYKQSRTRERRLLIMWVLGFFALGPFMSGLSNARILGLIVPIVILAAQTVFEPNYAQMKFSGVINSLAKTRGLAAGAVAIALSAIPALVLGKLSLAILKRVSENQTIVYNLPYVWMVILALITILALKRKHFLKTLLLFDVYVLLFLPIAVFIPLLWSYLNFFGLAPEPRTTVISLITVVSFIAFWMLLSCLSYLKKIVIPLIGVYVLFNLAGLTTIIYRPTYNIANSANRLGEIVGENSFIGFYGHELSLNNRSFPIYWAPRLISIESMNVNWQDFNPQFLLVTTVFDSKTSARSDWPEAKDVNKPLIFIEGLDLTRQFLGSRREFKIDIYKIGN